MCGKLIDAVVIILSVLAAVIVYVAIRDSIWKHKENVVGQLIKYKYFEVGNYEKPRFPVFLGFRSKEDM